MKEFDDHDSPFRGLPGLGLGDRLGAADPGVVGAQDLGDGIAGWERMAAWVKAKQLAWINELDQRCSTEFGEQMEGAKFDDAAGGVAIVAVRSRDATAAELSAILSISHYEAKARVATAVALHSHLARTQTALEAGDITSGKAELLASRLAKIAPKTALLVEAAALHTGAVLPRHQFARNIDAALIAVDPDGTSLRHIAARAERRIERPRALPDGMAAWRAVLPAEQAMAAHRGLTSLVRAAKQADSRTMDQLRADILTAMVIEAPRSACPVGPGEDGLETPSESHRCGYEVIVTVPASVLSGVDASNVDADDPARGGEVATLSGYGPIGDGLARMMAGDPGSKWRIAVTDDHTGRILDLAKRTYRPPADLMRLIRARYPRCVFPGCNRPSWECDLDHTIPFDQWDTRRGGQTCPGNLAPLCRTHHNLKTFGVWQLRQPVDGTFVWTSMLGRTYEAVTDGLDPPGYRFALHAAEKSAPSSS